MEQRISRLGQFINEAQWRFQLVSWDNGTNRQIIRSSRKRMNRKLQRIASSDENWKAVAAQDEDSDDTLTEGTSGENWEIKRFDRCKQWNDFYANLQISEEKKWYHVKVLLKSFLWMVTSWAFIHRLKSKNLFIQCNMIVPWFEKNLLERFYLNGHTDEEK